MIAVGTRIDRPSLDYDLLQVFRILLRHVPSAFVRSSKSADEAAAQRARALVNAGIDGPLTVEQVAGMERRKIEQWGGVVIDVRMRGNDLAFIGLIGTRHLVIRVDENIIGRETVHAIVDDLRAAGYPEVAVQ